MNNEFILFMACLFGTPSIVGFGLMFYFHAKNKIILKAVENTGLHPILLKHLFRDTSDISTIVHLLTKEEGDKTNGS